MRQAENAVAIYLQQFPKLDLSMRPRGTAGETVGSDAGPQLLTWSIVFEQTRTGLRLRHGLGHDIGDLSGSLRAKRGSRLPVVLSRDETKALIAEMEGLYLLMARLTYGSGLRFRECLRLRVKSMGAVEMPQALARKYANAPKEWCWKYVFPAPNLSIEPRCGRPGRHRGLPPLREILPAGEHHRGRTSSAPPPLTPRRSGR